MKTRFVNAIKDWTAQKRLMLYVLLCVGAWLCNVVLLFIAQQTPSIPNIKMVAGPRAIDVVCAVGGVAALFAARWVSSWIMEVQKAPYIARFMRVSALLMGALIAVLWCSSQPMFRSWLLDGTSSYLEQVRLLMNLLLTIIALALILVYLMLPYTEFIGFFAWQKKDAPMTVGSVCSKIMWVAVMVFLSLVVWSGIGLAMTPWKFLSPGEALSPIMLEEVQKVAVVVLFFFIPLQLIVAAWVRPTWKASVCVALINVLLVGVLILYPTLTPNMLLVGYAVFLIGCLLPGPKQAKKEVAVVPPQPVAVIPEQPVVVVEKHPVVAVQPAVSSAPRKRGRPSKKDLAAKAQPAKRKRGRPKKKA